MGSGYWVLSMRPCCFEDESSSFAGWWWWGCLEQGTNVTGLPLSVPTGSREAWRRPGPTHWSGGTSHKEAAESNQKDAAHSLPGLVR